MKAKRWISSLLLAALMALGASLPASAREVPYNTFNFDKWGNSVPAPSGYLANQEIQGSQLGIGEFSNPSDLFYRESAGEIYIVDSGNNRIVVIDEKYQLVKVLSEFSSEGGSEPVTLANPTGIYVTDDGTIYIADQDNGRVVICDEDGNVLNLFGKPVSPLITDEKPYRPSKIVVDEFGKIYVQASGVFEGIMCLNEDGSFLNYFGPNKVQMTFQKWMTQTIKNFMTKEQKDAMESLTPIEYSNLFIDSENFVYATVYSSGDTDTQLEDEKLDVKKPNDTDLVTKLNPLGVNLLGKLNMNWFQKANLTDITVDENGVMTMTDRILGKIYQCDKNGKLMFAFGGLGEQMGLFKSPSAIIEVNDMLLVLDSSKCNITEFRMTEFGAQVREAMQLYNEGRYEENIEPWEKVIRSDGNYLLAYTGLGQAYYQLGDYEKAMYYFQLGNDRSLYSDAFREYSLQAVRASFGWIVGGLAVLVIAIVVLRKVFRARKARRMGGKAA